MWVNRTVLVSVMMVMTWAIFVVMMMVMVTGDLLIAFVVVVVLNRMGTMLRRFRP